jgi:hypothetical protein
MKGERRLVERVLLRWTKLAEGRRFPRLNEFNQWMVGEELGELPCDSRAITNRAVALHRGGRKLGSCALPSGHAGRRSPVTSAVGRVLPLLSNCRGRGNAAERPILYRGALLPRSDDGGAINHVFGAANHRALIPDGAPITQAIRKRWI